MLYTFNIFEYIGHFDSIQKLAPSKVSYNLILLFYLQKNKIVKNENEIYVFEE